MSLTFVLIGLAAGVLAGLFGIGGGILIVPALVLLRRGCPSRPRRAPRSARSFCPSDCSALWSTIAKAISTSEPALLLAAGMFAGAYLGATLSQSLKVAVLSRLFAVFLVAVAVQTLDQGVNAVGCRRMAARRRLARWRGGGAGVTACSGNPKPAQVVPSAANTRISSTPRAARSAPRRCSNRSPAASSCSSCGAFRLACTVSTCTRPECATRRAFSRRTPTTIRRSGSTGRKNPQGPHAGDLPNVVARRGQHGGHHPRHPGRPGARHRRRVRPRSRSWCTPARRSEDRSVRQFRSAHRLRRPPAVRRRGVITAALLALLGCGGTTDPAALPGPDVVIHLLEQGSGSSVAATADGAADSRLRPHVYPAPAASRRPTPWWTRSTRLPRWEVVAGKDGVIWATRRTRVFRFVDDIYLLLLPAHDSTVIFARSASRIGRGDFGQNRRNLAEFWEAMEKAVHGSP